MLVIFTHMPLGATDEMALPIIVGSLFQKINEYSLRAAKDTQRTYIF
jgi:hypothetical protein